MRSTPFKILALSTAAVCLVFAGIFRPNKIDPSDKTKSVDPEIQWRNPVDPAASNYQGFESVDADGDGLPDFTLVLSNLSKTALRVKVRGVGSSLVSEMQWKSEEDPDWCAWTAFASPFDTGAGPGSHLLFVRLKFKDGKVSPPSTNAFTLNRPPVPIFLVSNLGSFIKAFDARATTDPDDAALLYAWDVDGDGVVDRAWAATNRVVTNSYLGGGTNLVVLWVKDSAGCERAATNTCIRVDYEPVPAFSIVSLGQTNKVFDATASFDAAGDPLEYAWDLNADGVIDLDFAASNRVITNLYTTLGTNQVVLLLRDHPAFTPHTNVLTNACARTNLAPVASFWISNANRTNKFFFAAATSDPEGNALEYAWDLDGNGSIDVPFAASNVSLTNRYTALGTNTVTLWARDSWLYSNSLSLSNICTNRLASIVLAAPTNGAVYTLYPGVSNKDLSIMAAVEDPDGTVTNVALYTNGFFAAASNAPPWEWTATLPIGTNLLQFVLFDRNGQSNVSSSNLVTITNGTWPVGLLLWNKLGSDAEVSNSAYGSNMTRSGSVAYNAAVHANGTQITGSSSYLSVPKSCINAAAGAVEFWFKPNFSSIGISTYKTLLDTDATPSPDRMILGWYSGGFYHNGFQPSVNVFTTPAFASNQSVHFAVIWNIAGISGTSSTVRVYVDGVQHSQSTGAVNSSPSFTKLYLGHHTVGLGNADGTMDNVKIWNFAKTNFADRFTEGF